MASTTTDGIELSHAYVAMEEKEKKPSTIERLKRCLKATEKFFVPAILLVICVLMLLPAVFYTISRFKKEEVKDQESLQNTSECTNITVYSGDVCLGHLKELQTCLLGINDEEVHISSTVDQQANEDSACLTLSLIEGNIILLNITEECVTSLIPFMCLYLFPLCNDGHAYLPSQEECLTISDGVCQSLWMIPKASDFLPDCANLPQRNSTCQITELLVPNNSCKRSNVCSHDFFLDGGTCKPCCGYWHDYSYTVTTAIESSVIFAIIFGMVTAVIFLVISCFRRSIIFKFPPILMIYFIISLFIAGIFTLLGFSNREGFFCSSPDLIQTYSESTRFCNFIGAILTYLLLQVALFGALFMIAVFWTINCPFAKRSFDNLGRTKYLHITAVLVGLLVPVIPVILAFTTGGFIITNSPPFACLVRNQDVFFYSFLFPISITCAIELILDLLLIRKLIIHNGTIGIAERKLIAIFLYLILTFTTVVVFYTAGILHLSEYTNQLTAYFICESTGIAPNKTCDRSGFENIRNPEVEIVLYPIIGLLPVAFMLYVIDFGAVKQFLLRQCCVKDKDSQ